MAIEELDSGFTDGLDWAVDHDDVAGTIGVTVAGAKRAPGTLMLNGEVVRQVNQVVIHTFPPMEIDQFANQGRQVIFTNAALVGVSMLTNPQYGLRLAVVFQPS